MCGISGFTGFANNIDLANAANEIQKHRGPENQSIWHDDEIALAHQRLSIIDLSEAANQPFHKHHWIIVFNGEIYNYKELQQQLINDKGITFSTNSDTEVVLEMYHNYGVNCLDSLIGMFSFAVYNKITSELFIARDHFGIKPLFYTQINGGFAFSSELKTLINVPGFNKSINSKALVSCLNYLWVSGHESMFNGCFKLPPAHYMTYSKTAGLQLFKYWDLDDQLQMDYNENEIAEQLAQDIEQSIKRHMVADVPVSGFLSGGLDSSLISVIAKRQNENLSTYTIETKTEDNKVEQMPDDYKFAKLISEKYNIENHKLTIDSSIVKHLPFMVKMLDEPIGDPAAIITYLMCLEAKSRGVKVLLSGMGADEIFFGYRRQKATLIAIRFNKLPKFVKIIISKSVSFLPVKFLGRGFKLSRWANRFMTIANLPIDKAYMRSYSYYDDKQLRDLVTPKHWEGIDLLYKEHATIFNSKYKNDPINAICNTDISMFMLGLNLTYTDRASMAASVEVRVPFVDKHIVTRAMQIPGKYKIKKGVSKSILKKSAELYLPKEVIYRPKASFGAPIRSWISNDLKSMVDELLSESNINKRGLINYSFVKKLIDNDRIGDEDNAYQIYQLLTLELWLKENLEQ
jgi:asparagine synthase (glutamine-hydrolysing)